MCLKILIRENLFYGKREQLGPNRIVDFSKGTWVEPHNNLGKTGSTERSYSKSANLASAIRVRRSLRNARQNFATRKMRAESSMGLGRKVSVSSKKKDKATLYSPSEARATPAPTSKSHKEKENHIKTRSYSAGCHQRQRLGISCRYVHFESEKYVWLGHLDSASPRNKNPRVWITACLGDLLICKQEGFDGFSQKRTRTKYSCSRGEKPHASCWE